MVTPISPHAITPERGTVCTWDVESPPSRLSVYVAVFRAPPATIVRRMSAPAFGVPDAVISGPVPVFVTGPIGVRTANIYLSPAIWVPAERVRVAPVAGTVIWPFAAVGVVVPNVDPASVESL